MASKLKGLQINAVAFVDKGANPDAHVVLLKRDTVKKAKCPECGMEMGEGAKTCPDCGYSMEKRMSEAEKKAETERVAKLESDLKAATEALAKAKAESAKGGDTAALQKRLDEAEADAKKTRERLAKMEDDRLTDQYIAKVQKWTLLPVKADDFASTLKRIAKHNAEDGEAVEALCTKLQKALKESGLFTERGASGGDATGSAWAQIEAATDERVKKSDGKLTKEQAMSDFLNTAEGKALYKRYGEEQANV